MKRDDKADIFQCDQCGDCCRGYGGTFVSPKDIEKISAHIHVDAKSFVAEYCDMSGTRPVIRQNSDGYCVFFKEVCSIHPVKPDMCRKWPFIENVLIDVNNWRSMARSCPGMDLDAPDSLIIKRVKQELGRD